MRSSDLRSACHIVRVGLGLRIRGGLIGLRLVVLGGLLRLLGLLLVLLGLLGGVHRGLVLALRLLQRGVGLIQLGGGVVACLLLGLGGLLVASDTPCWALPTSVLA